MLGREKQTEELSSYSLSSHQRFSLAKLATKK